MKRREDYVEPKAIAHEPLKELSLMEKLQLQPKEATKRFTVDLEESLHRDLSILAAETGRTKADRADVVERCHSKSQKIKAIAISLRSARLRDRPCLKDR